MIYMMSGLIIVCCTTLIGISYMIRRNAQRGLETAVGATHDYEDRVDLFGAAAYLSRMEDVFLQIQENAQPVDWTITLWLGLDGLRIAPDGTSEWIKRSRSTPQGCAAAGAAGVGGSASGPLPPYWLQLPPSSYVSVLYADNRVVEIAAQCDLTMSLQAGLDRLRIENTIMSMQQQIQQNCLTPPLYPGWMQYPFNCKN